MATPLPPDRLTRGIALLGVALLAVGIAWLIPARFRSIHPRVLEVAAQGTPGLLDSVTDAVRRGQPGAARWFARAAQQAGGGMSNRITTLASGRDLARVDFDSGLAPAIAAAAPRAGADAPPVFDLVLPERSRDLLRDFLGGSRSPGTQAILRSRGMGVRQFIPADRAGGQPLDAAILLTGLLHERELMAPTLAADLRSLAERATPTGPNEELEGWYLNMVVLSRRLEWSALVRLLAVTPDVPALGRFALAAKAFPKDLPLLYASAVLSGDPAGVADQLLEQGESGRAGLRFALGLGAGAVRILVADGRPLLAGNWVPALTARWAMISPWSALAGRSFLFFFAALSALMGLGQLAGPTLAGAGPASGWGAWGLRAGAGLALGGLLAAAGEPIPPRIGPRPQYQLHLQLAAASPPTASNGAAVSPPKNMDIPTLVTIGVFATIQITVFVICVRKIDEIARLSDPPLVRLRLLENEDNLFDTGLYVGIAGTAAALVLQVLHLVEANLLAAYSSNLMGVITVALVKIRYVRPSKRRLILEAGS